MKQKCEWCGAFLSDGCDILGNPFLYCKKCGWDESMEEGWEQAYAEIYLQGRSG